MTNSRLVPGSVISYSAGSNQFDPDGYRILRFGTSVLDTVARRWPQLLAPLGVRLPMLINLYPAPTGPFEAGVLVDTYLSVRTACRALRLAATEGMAVILVGQPLLLTEALLRYARGGWGWPTGVVLATGGYPMPRSLEAFIRSIVCTKVGKMPILFLFGAAEVDAGCLVGVERAGSGEVLYHVRGPDVVVEMDGDALLLSVLGPDGTLATPPFRTGDRVTPHGDGFIITNPRRFSSDVLAELELWSEPEWSRRTGYLDREAAGGFVAQLRAGIAQPAPDEMEYYDFARRTELDWARKPRWS